jgi:hypothetical protein
MENGELKNWQRYSTVSCSTLSCSLSGILYSDLSLALGTPSLDRVADRFTIVGADAGFCRSRRWVQIHHKLPRHKV